MEEKILVKITNNNCSNKKTFKKQENKDEEENNEIFKHEKTESGILSDGEIISSTVGIISSDSCSFDDFSDFQNLSCDNDDQRDSSSVKFIKNDLSNRDHKYCDSFLRSFIHKSKIQDRRRKHRHKRKRYRSSSSERCHELVRHDKWLRQKGYFDCRKESYYGRSEYSSSRKKKTKKHARSRNPYYKEYKRNQNDKAKDNRKYEKIELSSARNSYHQSVFNLNSSTEVTMKNKATQSPISRQKKRCSNTEIDGLHIKRSRTSSNRNWNSELEKNKSNQTKQIHSDDKTDITALNGKESENFKTSKNLTLNNKPVDIEGVSMINSVQLPVAPYCPPDVPLPQLPPNSYKRFDTSNAYSKIPLFGQDNIPLGIGTNGLPVYFTPHGYQIPYDIDGRRVPIGPNGHYLPLDPFGRVFAHVISPDNVAIPIHMTEDGVLRLPNSEPVPFGPPHQLPINIDGQIILMGPDSRPIYPCPDVPKCPLPTFCDKTSSITQNDVSPPIEKKNISSLKPQPPIIDVNLLEVIDNTFPVNQKNELLKHYKADVRQNKNTFLNRSGKEKDLKKGIAKTSTPVKMTTSDKPKESGCGNSSDMDLDSSDLDSLNGINFAQKSTTEDCGDVFSSDCEGNLKIVCDVSTCDVMAPSDDPVITRIQAVLKSMGEGNFKPPSMGRFFIVSELNKDLSEPVSNASPLLRNRVQLPFISCCIRDFEGELERENEISFKFYSRRKIEKVTKKKVVKEKEACDKRIYTLDFTQQCDFTSEVINGLNEKVKELSDELVKVKKLNTNLMHMQRQQQDSIKETTRLLNKALSEIKEKTVEMESLKRALEKKHKPAN